MSGVHGPQITPQTFWPRTLRIRFCCADAPGLTQRPSIGDGSVVGSTVRRLEGGTLVVLGTNPSTTLFKLSVVAGAARPSGCAISDNRPFTIEPATRSRYDPN